eukprot:6338522-Amphidinium_carterae.1
MEQRLRHEISKSSKIGEENMTKMRNIESVAEGINRESETIRMTEGCMRDEGLRLQQALFVEQEQARRLRGFAKSCEVELEGVKNHRDEGESTQETMYARAEANSFRVEAEMYKRDCH